MAGRVTQLVVEAVIAATDANVRVTQVAVEAVIAPTSTAVRTSQIVVEVVVSPTSTPLVVSQAGIEVAKGSIDPTLVVSQSGIEVATRTFEPALIVSQAGFEVAVEVPKGAWSLDARLVYNDGYPDRRSNWTTVNALKRIIGSGSFAANAVIKRTIVTSLPAAVYGTGSATHTEGTTHTATVPAHVAGDRLVAVSGWYPNWPTVTNPTGWTLLHSASYGTVETGVCVWTKVAASPSDTFSFTSSNGINCETHIWALSPSVPVGTPVSALDPVTGDAEYTIPAMSLSTPWAQLLSFAVVAGDRSLTPIAGTDKYLGGGSYSWAPWRDLLTMWDAFAGSDPASATGQMSGVGREPVGGRAAFEASPPVAITLDAFKSLRFFVDAQIGYWFRVEAEIVPRRFMADAVIKRTLTGSYTVNATRLWTVSKTNVTAKAVIRWTVVKVPGFTADAVIMPRFRVEAFIQPYFWTDAITRWTVSAGFTADALITPYFTVGAFIQPYFWANARLELGFLVNAVLKKTMGVPALQPLVYPGTRQTLYNNVANALTPLVSIGEGELLTVRVVTPPSDGGDLGAFNTTLTLNYGITASPGEYVLSVLPGQYYIYSSKNNVFRPGLTGSGSYSSWSVSYLQITVDAFVQPVFRVDAAIVWLFTTLDPPPDPFTLGAWLKRIWLRSFPASAFVQPWFWVNAYSVPRHFHVSAWIIRYRSGSFTANAFLEWRHFHVSAAKKQTWTKGFTVAAFKDHPIYGFFNVDARINWYFIAQAAFVVVKYRRRTVSAVKRWVVSPPVTGWEYWWAYPPVRPTINAFVQPYFRVDAYLFRMEFFLDAVILDERERGFAANAKFVWTFLGSTTANAFVQPWFTLRAIRREELDGSLIVRSWLVKLVTVAFTINAEIRGTWAKAVIFHPDMRGVFNIYAWRGEAARTRTFLAQAEMSDPGAYWDPYTETWLHLHFLADAAIVIHREPTATVDASIAVENLSLLSFPADALIYGEPVDLFWLEAWIDAQKTIVYEGDGYTDQVLTTFTERLTFPGWDDSIGGGSNRLSSIIDTTADGERVSFTVWDWSWNPVGGSSSLGFVSVHENLWTNGPTGGGHSPQGVYQADGNTYSFIPQYSFEPHHAYA